MLRIKYSILKGTFLQLVLIYLLSGKDFIEISHINSFSVANAKEQAIINTQDNGQKKKFRKRRRFDPIYSAKEIQKTWAQTFSQLKGNDQNLNCDQAIDQLLLKLPDVSSLFYALVNGWYLGQWADYSSCLTDAANSQYILATVKGNLDPDQKIQFTRGGQGKYSGGFTTSMGLCFPKQCTLEEVQFFTKDLIYNYAAGVGWTNITVEYNAVSNDVDNQSQMTTGAYVTFGILAIAFSFVLIGNIVELSTCGDQESLKEEQQAELLYQAAKFRRLNQYDAVLIQRKKSWAQQLLPFSFLRNGVQLNILPRGCRNQIKYELDNDSIKPENRIAQNLKVFNGLKGSSILLIAWGYTYFFAWYSFLSNPNEINDKMKSYNFNFVTGTLYTIPIFFFCSGFLQTLSFLDKDEKQSQFTTKNLIKFYTSKILRYAPLNIMAFLTIKYLIPIVGSGPIWMNYQTMLAPCNTYWWTNMVYINNVYPRDYDDKCLAWNWFLPCYVQLSMLLPFFLAFYKIFESNFGKCAFFTFFLLLNLVSNFLWIYEQNIGGSIVQNEQFFAKIYMNPSFHFSSFFFGMIVCFLYIEIKKERTSIQKFQESSFINLIYYICSNVFLRYTMYLLGMVLMTFSVLWQTPFSGSPQGQSQLQCALYATFSYLIYLFGMQFILIPALIGKAELFRFVYGSQTWTMLSQMSIGLCYTFPMIALFYFISTQHQIELNYYMFIYYFAGNMVFGIAIYFMIVMPIDRPIHAFINLKQDIIDAQNSYFYKLDQYMKNFNQENEQLQSIIAADQLLNLAQHQNILQIGQSNMVDEHDINQEENDQQIIENENKFDKLREFGSNNTNQLNGRSTGADSSFKSYGNPGRQTKNSSFRFDSSFNKIAIQQQKDQQNIFDKVIEEDEEEENIEN